jgi:lysozyme family protein
MTELVWHPRRGKQHKQRGAAVRDESRIAWWIIGIIVGGLLVLGYVLSSLNLPTPE